MLINMLIKLINQPLGADPKPTEANRGIPMISVCFGSDPKGLLRHRNENAVCITLLHVSLSYKG